MEKVCCKPCPCVESMCPACNQDIHRCRSRELRASILYMSCDCIKRNGLQQDCQRNECQGRPCCLVKPFPLCGPGRMAGRYALMTMGVTKGRKSANCET